jgi:hypothetical protein
LLFFFATLSALLSPAVLATDTKDYLEFYPPFVTEDIAGRVQQRQEELGSAQVRTTMRVQYGTR